MPFRILLFGERLGEGSRCGPVPPGDGHAGHDVLERLFEEVEVAAVPRQEERIPVLAEAGIGQPVNRGEMPVASAVRDLHHLPIGLAERRELLDREGRYAFAVLDVTNVLA